MDKFVLHDETLSFADMNTRGWNVDETRVCWAQSHWTIRRAGQDWLVLGPVEDQQDPHLPDAGFKFRRFCGTLSEATQVAELKMNLCSSLRVRP